MRNPGKVLIDGSRFGLDWLKIYWYGALIAVGIVLAYILASHEAKRRGFKKDTVIDMCLIAVPLGAVCARLYYVIFSWEEYFNPSMTLGESLLAAIDVRGGGLAIYGAVIGGLLGVFIYSRVKKAYFFSHCDLAIPGLVLAQAIGRWGNFFNQEAYGRLVADWFPRYWPLAVSIDDCRMPCCADLADRTGNIHYATFFYESCWCLLIFVVLWFFLRKRAKHRGDITLTYLMLYGFGRMFIEGLRTDSLMLGPVRVSQALSALLFVGILTFFIVRAVKEKKTGVVTTPYSVIYYGEAEAAAASDEDEKEPDNEPEPEQPEPEKTVQDMPADGEGSEE